MNKDVRGSGKNHIQRNSSVIKKKSAQWFVVRLSSSWHGTLAEVEQIRTDKELIKEFQLGKGIFQIYEFRKIGRNLGAFEVNFKFCSLNHPFVRRGLAGKECRCKCCMLDAK